MIDLRKLIYSFGYACKGILALFATQQNMRIHTVAMIAVIALAAYLRVSATDWAVLVLCMGMVLSAEAVNTAIEWFTDMVKPEVHPLAAKVKDVAAAGVLFASIFSAIAGILIFGKYFFQAA